MVPAVVPAVVGVAVAKDSTNPTILTQKAGSGYMVLLYIEQYAGPVLFYLLENQRISLLLIPVIPN